MRRILNDGAGQARLKPGFALFQAGRDAALAREQRKADCYLADSVG